MNRFRLVVSLCACMLVLAGVGYSSPLTFTGTLSGANENPATGSPGTGSALVTFDPVTALLTVNVTFSGLEAGSTASHIHCCVAPGGTAGVATPVPTFPGFPLGVTSGTYAQTFDLTLASSFNPAFVTANGGTVAGAEAAFAAGLENGMAYLNVHTTAFPGGEVRAFLAPVPEPVSGTLFAGALGMLWLMRRRSTAR
ncbi:MAG: CHRD domain-containing protein [Acidobacteriia bacterium]|nr:CHRD domain-containing protein [Terriglobia bacterium]